MQFMLQVFENIKQKQGVSGNHRLAEQPCKAITELTYISR